MKNESMEQLNALKYVLLVQVRYEVHNNVNK